mmetsp:Transcript_10689/g.23901  ORF Transcript_10689/g.23901 Transcript_10689/m.23901 type:complete len:557 (-) Transcript_10689:84-1754(-)
MNSRSRGHVARALFLLLCTGSEAFFPAALRAVPLIPAARRAADVMPSATVGSQLRVLGGMRCRVGRATGQLRMRIGASSGADGKRKDMEVNALKTSGTLSGLSELDGDASYSDGESSSEFTQDQTLVMDLNKENAFMGGVATKRVTSWWKHKDKHRVVFPPESLSVDYAAMLGDGTYGEVFMADLLGGEETRKGVAKRAKDGCRDTHDPAWSDHVNVTPDEDERDSLAGQYLETEAYINDLVMDIAPTCAAPYLGKCSKGGKDWLVFSFLAGETLEDLLVLADKEFSLRALASELHVEDFVDDDVRSLRRLVNCVAEQLLQCCLDLQRAGVAHRDIKPYNLYVSEGRIRLIDFGSAAAMGMKHRTGYDYNKSPCDPRYAPPEQFIDEEHWAAFDVYCVGLILVRILFPPLWGGQHFDEFSDSYHAAQYDLDAWLSRIILADVALTNANAAAEAKNPLKAMFNRRSRDQEYVDLAEDSCNFPDDGSLLNMCAIKEGLEVLNQKDGGVCWETLRQLLAKEPRRRISGYQALRRVLQAEKRDAGELEGGQQHRGFFGKW